MEEGEKAESKAAGQGLANWIISEAEERRFLPRLFTSGLHSSAHIHLFNLRKLHLMSYTAYRLRGTMGAPPPRPP